MRLFQLISALLFGIILNSCELFAQEYVYVCNQNSASITVIDVESLEIEETISLQELGFSASAKPHHAIVEPDGSYWYVSLIGEHKVLKFNAVNKLIGETEIDVPGLLSLHPTKDILYVGRSMSAVNPPQSFGIIKRSDMTLKEEVDLIFSRPHAIANLDSAEHLFVASLSSNQILSMNTEHNEAEFISMEGMNHMFVNFAISPDQNTLVGTTQMTGKLLIFDITNPLNLDLTDIIDVNAQPWHPVYSNDGHYVYFGNKETNSVTAINMITKEVESVIEEKGLAQPHGAVLSSDNKYLFITNNHMKMEHMHSGEMMHNGTVAVIDTKAFEIIKIIEVGINPTGIGGR